MRALAAAALAAAALAAAACSDRSAPAGAPAGDAVPIAAEDLHRVRRERIQTGPRIAGSLLPRERADVRAQLAGSVLEVHAEIGQAVRKGQVLARIEDRAQRDAVRAARAAVRAARQDARLAAREVARARALVEAGALAARDVEKAQSGAGGAHARAGEARARLASVTTQLDGATARAPIDGVVSAAPVHQGDVVAPGAPLFTIIDPTSMRLEASVSSEDLSSLVVGAPVVFEVRGYAGQRFEGTVSRIAPAADEATRQIPILVAIPNDTGKLMAGLFADGRLASASREALVAPLAAIDRSGETTTVTRVRSGVVERVSVQLGVRDAASEQVEVAAGLAAGDVVLLRSARSLPPGTAVALPADVSPAPAPAGPAAPAPGPASPAAPPLSPPAGGSPSPAPAAGPVAAGAGAAPAATAATAATAAAGDRRAGRAGRPSKKLRRRSRRARSAPDR